MKIRFLIIVFVLSIFGCRGGVKKIPVTHGISSAPYIYFVSQRDSLPTIYSINLVDLKIEKVLPDTFGAVQEIKFSPDGNVALFKVSEFEGTVGAGFHLIKAPKVYLFDIATGEIGFLRSFDDSWSVKIKWLSDDTIEVYRTSGGFQTGTNFVVEIFGYDSEGNLLYSKKKEYDWRAGEYPEESKDVRLNSPLENLGVEIRKDSLLGLNKIYLRNGASTFEIFETRWEIRQLEWSDDGKFLVFSIVNITPEAVESRNVKTGELYFFDIEKRNLFKIASGSGLFNFRFINEAEIIFDQGFENDAEIYLFNLYNREMKKLTDDDFPDGVFGIPKILGFSA